MDNTGEHDMEFINSTKDLPVSDTGDHRPDVYYEEEKSIYRASSLGGCQKSLVMQRAGMDGAPAPEFMEAAFATGTRLEPLIIREFCQTYGMKMLDGIQLEQYGTISSNGQLEVKINVGKAVVKCHPDGVVQCFKADSDAGWNIGDRFVLEIKALGKSLADRMNNSGFDSMPQYEWQWATEMVGTGLNGFYVVAEKCEKCKGTGHEINEQTGKEWPLKCGECDGKMFKIKKVDLWEEPVRSKVEIVKRVMQLEKLGETFDAGEQVNCDFKMFPCKFYQLHDNEGIWAEEKVTLPNEVEVEVKVRVDEYKKLRRETSDQIARMERLKEEIKEWLGKVERLDKFNGLGIKYTVTENKGRLNEQLIREAGLNPDQLRGKSTIVKKIEFTKDTKDKEES